MLLFLRKRDALYQHGDVTQESTAMGEDQVPGSVPPTAEQDGDPQSLTSCVTARQY